MLITFTRVDGQTLTLPVIMGATHAQCDGEWTTISVPMLDESDDAALEAFSGEARHLMQTVQYLYAEADMTRSVLPIGERVVHYVIA